VILKNKDENENNEAFQSIVCDITSLLLHHGADMNQGYDVRSGWKTIHYACYIGFVKLVQILLEHHRQSCTTISTASMIQSGFNGDGDQTTALHAIDRYSNNFIPVVNILLQYGTDINSQDSSGNTLLQDCLLRTSRHMNSHKYIPFLINDCHADFLTIQNKNGKTAWDISMNDRVDKMFYRMMEQKRRQ
jgi:ankyrin repeat protein